MSAAEIKRLHDKREERLKEIADTQRLKNRIMASSYRHNGPDLGYLFDKIDKDGTGHIGILNFTATVKKIIPDISQKQLSNLMKAADEDGSGQLSKDEFISFVMSGPPAIDSVNDTMSMNSEQKRKEAKTQKHIDALQEQLLPLNRHWSTGLTKVPLGPSAAFASDVVYKNHVLRLSEVYTEYEPPKDMDYKKFKFPMLAPPGPLQQLYGTKGLLRLSPRSLDKSRKDREVGWNPRFTAGFKGLQTHLAQNRDKSVDGGELGFRSPIRSLSPKNNAVDRSKDSRERTKRTQLHPNQESQSILHQPTRSRYRCTDDNISNNELTKQGLYRFEQTEEQVYTRFVEVLSNFDSHDVTKILDDARRDYQENTLLSEYCGFG